MPINIRKAKISDLLKTYEWANEKEVIKSSIERSSKVSLTEHKKWFKKYLISKIQASPTHALSQPSHREITL